MAAFAATFAVGALVILDGQIPSAFTTLFFLPIIWIGYDPVWVYGMVSASLSYQFFVHTELVPRIGWLEWLVNTPRPIACITRAIPSTSTRTTAAYC